MSAFLICVETLDDFFASKQFFQLCFDDLLSGDKNHICHCWPFTEGSLLEQGDLIILMEKEKSNPLLVAIGKTVTDYAYNETGHTIEIHFDFMQGEHKDFTQYSVLLQEAEIDLNKKHQKEIQLSAALTEKLIKRFAVVHMACAYPHSGFAFNHKIDKKQLLCDYLNEFCPEFRKEIIKRFPLEYNNYKKGEVIDKDLIDLTYDKSNKTFPGAVLDWNLLFDIIRPRA